MTTVATSTSSQEEGRGTANPSRFFWPEDEEPDQFKAWLDTEPPMSEWMKVRRTSEQMLSIKKNRKESL